ncbi:GNAT family N-acetyltransferase [Paenibacillus agricola]|uniref:GNAT family N-acetyltransferase n=1 Tax=Paenibacillus agricola TaxID=2716264 RepID=A0ABX0JGU6_9BACL|nr:GNAT family protein [Paenibacillus agricola]NHN34615.1 GNAT family N-acetyltransferase [Paenibacillus agricola]
MNLNYWKGETIQLRAVEARDAVAFYDWNHDAEISRNIDAIHFPQSLEQVKQWIERDSQIRSEKFRWIAENKEGEVVGTIDTFSCFPRQGTFKYGIVLGRSHWGKGYAKEMIKLVLRYYFQELGYQKVTPHVYSFNERSIHLHESLGFKREGQLRNMLYTDGRYYDEIYFGMTRDEFNKLYG